MSQETIEITDQEIQKALDILKSSTIVVPVEDLIEKAKKEAEGKKEPIDNKDEEEAEKKLAEKKANFEKSMCDLKGIKKGFKDTYKAKKDELKKAFPDEWKEKKESKSKEKSEKGKEKKHDEPLINKAEEGTALLSVTTDPIVKAMSDQIGALNTLIVAQRAESAEIKKSLDIIGSQSTGVRSLKNIHAIEKSFQDEIQKGVKILSISQNKDLISRTLLDLSNIEKGEANEFYTSATLLFDTSKMLEQSTLTDLYTNHKIKIVD
jgi:hypothetical protein